MKKEQDLLKGAIADAKKIRETALANAKRALEEAFTPQLQSMFSTKVQEELEDEDELEDEVPMDAPVDDAPPVDDEPIADDEEELDEMADEDDIKQADPGMHSDEGDPALAEEEEVEDELEVEPQEDDLDLDEIIAELEAEEDEVDEPAPEAEEDEFEISESDDEELDIDIEDDEELDAEPIDEDDGMSQIPPEREEDDDDEIDLQELYDELVTEDDTPPLGENPKTVSAAPDGSYKGKEHQMQNPSTGAKINELETSLKESYDVIRRLRKDINEVNLLNAKLLFANKLFKKYNLNEGSKKQIIETLDRAQSGREAKLIFVTLAESMGQVSNPTQVKNKRNAQTITEGLASKSTASTKPSKKIVNELADRWTKLANIK